MALKLHLYIVLNQNGLKKIERGKQIRNERG